MDKTWAKNANKIFENKMVLYFTLFLSVATILGFLFLKNLHAVVLFVLFVLATFILYLRDGRYAVVLFVLIAVILHLRQGSLFLPLNQLVDNK